MRILVTGGAGFIGSHFVYLAHEAGHEVFVLDALTYAGSRANVDMGACQRFYRGRVERAGDVAKCLADSKPDAVVHLAAETHVTRSIRSPRAFMQTNALGTYVLLDQCTRYRDESAPRLRVINVSTDEVYGSLTPSELPWTSQAPHRPNNPYAASKAAADHLAGSYAHTYELDVITTHSSNNYGPRQHPEKLIPALIDRARRGLSMQIHGDGSHVRDWLHVDDHCSGLLSVLTAPSLRRGSTVNFSGQCERTNLQVAALVAESLSLSARVELVADRPGNDKRYAMTNDASEVLGWKPRSTLEDGIKETVNWYMDNEGYEAHYGK